MDSDTTINYYDLFSKYAARITDLTRRRDEIDREVTKLRELMLATFPLLPAEKQDVLQKEIDEIEAQSGSLIAAIKLVFSQHKGEWMTPPQVRDYLNEMGFDLTKYRANPLASIGTTLKRLPDADTRIETKALENGQIAYQRRIGLLDQLGMDYKRGLEALGTFQIDPDKLPEEMRGVLGYPPKGGAKKK